MKPPTYVAAAELLVVVAQAQHFRRRVFLIRINRGIARKQSRPPKRLASGVTLARGGKKIDVRSSISIASGIRDVARG